MIVSLLVAAGILVPAVILGGLVGWWTTRDAHPEGHPFSWWLFTGPWLYHRQLARRGRAW